MAVKNVVLDRTFGNNLSGQKAIEVIFGFTVANSLDNDEVPRSSHFLNLGERTPYIKSADGQVREDLSTRAVADAKLWNYENSRVFSFGDAWALRRGCC